MNVLFDMETGDPDDLITLLLLLNNPEVNLKGITCFQGSPIQIGLIAHVLQKAGRTDIPVGGWNTVEPTELSPYYHDVIGSWKEQKAILTPVEVFAQVMNKHTHDSNNPEDNVVVLTGAPLTNLKLVLEQLPNLVIPRMITQGGFLGEVVPEEKRLKKFLGKTAFRTYNLELDLQAFEMVNGSPAIESLTYVTKDLCHGFMYTPEIHQEIHFGSSPVSQLLKSALSRYAENGKSKAMHDPLAMLMMLYPQLGNARPISMSYYYDHRNLPVFTSVAQDISTIAATTTHISRQGVVEYDKDSCWSRFTGLCQDRKLKPAFR